MMDFRQHRMEFFIFFPCLFASNNLYKESLNAVFRISISAFIILVRNSHFPQLPLLALPDKKCYLWIYEIYFDSPQDENLYGSAYGLSGVRM